MSTRMVPVHYGILGTTTAHREDGTAVPLGGARLRALLTALALRQGRPVPTDLLVDEVWGAEPPQDCAAALQTLVGRLRRAIGRDEIGSGPAGYWLTGRNTDLGEFQRLVAEGRQATAAADHARAAERLGRALGLWRGPALADLPDRGGPAARLETQREEARRCRIGAELELGRAAELTAELAELCAERPLDEQLQLLLVRALNDSGRTAEALQQYERARRALAEQLGADPGPALQAVHRELLRSTVPGPAVPQVPPAAYGFATHPPIPAAGEQRRPAAPRPVGNLRPRLTSFVGREAELAALKSALTASRLVTLTGPGGSGKTSLAVEAGRAAAEAVAAIAAAGATGAPEGWPDGVWLAELAPLEDPGDVPAAVLSALGLRETVLHTGGAVAEAARTDDPVRRIVEHCAQRRMLLVLDNCEHLIQAAAELADRLLAECPGLTVLATSREPLGVPGESVRPVEPLPDPVALRLLAERGAAARPGFDPAEDPEACAEICRRLDGLPLAIELAAARLRGLTPRRLADRLDGRFALLTAGSRTLLPRQQTLRAVVDWSWDLLSERECAVLRRLSVFAGSWTLEDAEQVCADGTFDTGPGAPGGERGVTAVPREEVADLLLSLVDKSLIVARLGTETRYWMLETIHEYAAERLTEAMSAGGADEGTALRHIRCFRELVRSAERHLRGPDQLRWLAVLEREQDNIRAALRRAVDGGEEQEALVLVLGMSWFWALRDYRTEARGWYEAVGALAPNPYADDAPRPVPLSADPLDAPPPMPPELLQEARRQVHLHRLVTMFIGNMEMLGDPEATDLAQRVLAAYTPDLPQSFRLPVLHRVFAAFPAGAFGQLRPMLDEAVEGCRRHGGVGDLAFILQIRSHLLNDWSGGLDQAIRDGDEALELFTRLGDRWGMSEALSAKGETALKQGDSARATEAYRKAIELARELEAPQEIPLLRIRLGEALLDTDVAEGERLIREVLGETATGRADQGATLYGCLLLCNLSAARGDYAEALDQLDQLDRLEGDRSVLGPLVPNVFRGIVTSIRAWITALSGDPEAGLDLLREARRLVNSVENGGRVFAEHMTVMLVLPAVGVLTAVAELRGDPAVARRAAVLMGAYQTLHGALGSYLERQERDRGERRLRALIGDRAYQEGLAEGGGLTLAEAAAMMNDPDGSGA
ncbi:AfsR/SARP family transcriptional regulator [Kitasatospora sp. NPDC001175]|uniref:AfsR/SARP family transcriptional regulator n=1 Tax=Kitasatospora sp. NPDC001175 TaxID=3157103 RepID=UPI003CFD000E